MNWTCRDTEGRIPRFLDDELEADDRAALEGHLSGCARCRAEMDAARAWRDAWKRAPRLASTPAERAAVLAAAEPLLAAAGRAHRAGRAEPSGRTGWAVGRWFAPVATDLVTAGALTTSLVLALVLLGVVGPGRGPRPRAGPVLNLAEFAAREQGLAIGVAGTFSMADPIEWRGIGPSPGRRMR